MQGATRTQDSREERHSLDGVLKILLIERDRLAAIELRDFLHFLGHVALWSDDGALLPAGFAFDLVMLSLPEAPSESAAIIERIARQRIAPALAIMSDADRRETEAAAALAADLGLAVFGPLPKPLRPDQVAAALEAPMRRIAGKPGAGSVSLISPEARKASYVFQSKHALRNGAVVGYETLLRVPGVTTIDRWFAGLDHGAAFAMTVAAARAAFGLSGQIGGGRRSPSVAFHCPPEIFGDARFLAELSQMSRDARQSGKGGGVAIELTASKDGVTLSDITSIAFRYVLAGFELHMSDFAMKAVSLDQVVGMPINEAKIDRSFFHELLQNDPLLLGEIVSLFRMRGIRSTVARIEAADEFAAARQAGADCGQGYYWSQPTNDVRL